MNCVFLCIFIVTSLSCNLVIRLSGSITLSRTYGVVSRGQVNGGCVGTCPGLGGAATVITAVAVPPLLLPVSVNTRLPTWPLPGMMYDPAAPAFPLSSVRKQL